MTLRNKLIILIVSGVVGSAYAQVNSLQSAGYVERAAAMLSSGNYQGCMDQLDVALSQGSPQRQRILWMQCVASFRGRFPEAGTLLRAFMSQFPQSPNNETAEYMLASLDFYAGRWPEALKGFEAVNASALEPSMARQLTLRRGICRLKLGQLRQAEADFESLKSNPEALFYRGYIAYLQGEDERALPLLESARTDAAPGCNAPLYMAQIYFRQGKFADALQLAEPFLQNTDPAIAAEAQCLAGEANYALGNERTALSLLRPYMEAHAADAPPSARYIVGLNAYQEADYHTAISLLAPVTELHNAMGQSAALTVGQCYMAEGNNTAALMSFDKASRLDLDPAITELAYYNYAVAQVDGGRIPFASSVNTLEEFLKRYPRSSYARTVQDYLVKGYMAGDDYEGALRSLNALKGKQTAEQLDLRRQVLLALGARALRRRDTNAALTYLQEADRVKTNALADQTKLWLADAEYAAGNYKAAEVAYDEYMRLAPRNDLNRSTATYNLAYALFGQRKYDAARSQFLAAEKFASLPADVKADTRTRIADTYYYGSDFRSAHEAYKQAFELQPSTGDYALLQQALMEGHLGRNSDKLASLDRLVGLFPTSALRPAALTEKAMTQTAMKRPADAIATYQDIAATYPATRQGRNALLQLAILHDNSGHSAEAIEYYKQVVKNYPTAAEAALAVQDLKRLYGANGNIEELDHFLSGIANAPQLDAEERNAIAAASLLRTARQASAPAQRLEPADKLLTNYPDAESAEEAMLIAAQAEYDLGRSQAALDRFSTLEQRASTATMRHNARMGMLRAARDMGLTDTQLSVSQRIMQSGATAASDLPEVKFIRATALAADGQAAQASEIWEQLAASPSNLYGTRASYELADADFRASRLDEAYTRISALIDADPPHAYWLARSYILLSDILRAQGNDFEADEYLRVLRTNYPGTDADIFQLIDRRLPNQ